MHLKNPLTRIYINHLIKYKDTDEIKILQRALKNLGQSLNVDGVIGNITLGAIKRVNNKRLALEIEKLRYTIPYIKHNEYPIQKCDYMKYAIDELGVKEYKGKASNPRVEEYHKIAGLPNTKDEVPWCASFIAFVMYKAGYKLPKKPARALSWLKFGKSVGEPCYGALAIKKRKGGGHITLVVGINRKNPNIIYCLGGNQNDEVNIKPYNRDIFIDFRLPDNCNKNLLPFLDKKDNHLEVKEF